jgi:hypothetical protein
LALADLDLDKDPFLQERGHPKEALIAARSELLLRVALLRALAQAGQRRNTSVVDPIFDLAFSREGLLRDECGRALRSIGSYAVPALLHRQLDKKRSPTAQMRRYAAYQLDRMDRLRPSQALAQAADDLNRAEILHTYGVYRTLDAVEPVLSYVDAPSHRVRREARWAFRNYVDGPPPPPVPKRKRKLPGGGEEAEEKEDYLNYREMATLVLHKRLRALTGQAGKDNATAKELTDQVFAYYDNKREAEFAQIFRAAKDAEASFDLVGAVDRYGWILAHQPDHPRRGEMARAYARLGQKLALDAETQVDQGKKPSEIQGRATGLLRQALAINPRLSDQAVLRAHIHYLDGQSAQQAGASGESDFRQALAVAKDFAPAQRALASLAAQKAKEQHKRRQGTGITLALTLGLLLSLSLVIALRRRLLARPGSTG